MPVQDDANVELGSDQHVLSAPPLYAGIGQPEQELVEFEGRCFVSVEPHRIACCLAQFVSHRAGDQWDGEAVHLFTTHSGEEAGYITYMLPLSTWRTEEGFGISMKVSIYLWMYSWPDIKLPSWSVPPS